MKTILRSAVLALCLSVASAAGVAAQEALQPSPLDAASPRAQRARGLAELVVAGDSAKASAYLKEHAASAYAEQSQADLGQLLQQLRGGTLTIFGVDDLGGNRVGVPLVKGGESSPSVAILLTLDAAAPHRIVGMGLVRVNMGGT